MTHTAHLSSHFNAFNHIDSIPHAVVAKIRAFNRFAGNVIKTGLADHFSSKGLLGINRPRPVQSLNRSQRLRQELTQHNRYTAMNANLQRIDNTEIYGFVPFARQRTLNTSRFNGYIFAPKPPNRFI
jgi:hypothetical protein